MAWSGYCDKSTWSAGGQGVHDGKSAIDRRFAIHTKEPAEGDVVSVIHDRLIPAVTLGDISRTANVPQKHRVAGI